MEAGSSRGSRGRILTHGGLASFQGDDGSDLRFSGDLMHVKGWDFIGAERW